LQYWFLRPARLPIPPLRHTINGIYKKLLEKEI